MFFEAPTNIDFARYADDNTACTYSSKINNMQDNLQALEDPLLTVFNKFIGSKCRTMSLFSYNEFHNILRVFDVLPNFPFTSSETMGDYHL